MPKYGVPVSGAIFVEVEAEDEDDAREKAVEKAKQMDPANLGLYVNQSAGLEVLESEE